METFRTSLRFFILHNCLLIRSLVASSSLSSARFLMVSSTVGNQVVLPCMWKSRLGDVAPPSCHIEWVTPPANRVFEQLGERRWQALEFQGRVEVPEEKLDAGDCSLIISDVQIGDTGKYDSFMLVDGVRSKKTRVFIQSVKLSVFDHKSLESRAPGEDLDLDLRTRHSMRVVFQGRNSSEWTVLWMRGDADSQRLKKHPVNEQLTLTSLTSSDEGIYKVLDEHGLAVSTVQLSVEVKSTLRVEQNYEAAAGGADKSSSSAFLVLTLLVVNFQILAQL